MKRSIMFLFFCWLSCSCQKYLDKKSSNADVVPGTLKDLQAILDDAATMNGNFNGGVFPMLGQEGSDNFYVSYPAWQSQLAVHQNAYTWASDIFQGAASADWNFPYKIVFNANVVLEGLAKLNRDDAPAAYDNAMGAALFFRAHAFLAMAQIFCKPYSASTATGDPGMPLRASSDVNVPSVRSTVQETYDKIISDLREAEILLPVTSVPAQTRPVKIAAEALLARVWLDMDQYDSAKLYADKVLQVKKELLDFNKLDTVPLRPFPVWPNHPEIIHYASTIIPSLLLGSGYNIDSNLLRSYAPADLRRPVFYYTSGTSIVFKGRFSGSNYPFAGLATNEMYFIRAECSARTGNTAAALSDLNTLLITRWKTGKFVPYTAPDADAALRIILTERRKEFPFTGTLRWEDLRRLNKDPRFAISLTRILNGKTYTLPPNDIKYTYPLPLTEINIYHLAQNPR